ncbi:MAG: hypothetical protein IIT86_02930 [Oscillospiraceae bacterium]|nr:hypothetical protein [Lachnospiraceae bacterium]MBQ1778818.1 hypothetical protein [Acidaminococcaceae bacterium]MBQ5521756.1 hypothetical protein [Oscillospiraceae bacterium]
MSSREFKGLPRAEKAASVCLIIVCIPMIAVTFVIAAVMFVLVAPFEYPKYKRSRYYKRYRQKYHLTITREASYRIINCLEREQIPYEGYDAKEEELVIGGTTYLFPWFENITFDEDGQLVLTEEDGCDPTPLSEEPKVKGRGSVRIIVRKNYFEAADLERAYHDERLFLYDKASELETPAFIARLNIDKTKKGLQGNV